MAAAAFGMKAVILARGLGTRMREQSGGDTLSASQAAVAATGLKAMMPFGRPFLDYVLTAAADAGVTDVGLVIGPEHDEVRNHYGRAAVPRRVRVTFVTQPEPRGTADAVVAARAFVGADPFLVLNGDNYYPAAALRALVAVPPTAAAAFSRAGLLADGLIPPARLARFAILRADDEGWLRSIVEKPDPSWLDAQREDVAVSMNCWWCEPAVLDACATVERSPRGEFELPVAIQHGIDRGLLRVRAVPVDAPVLDLSSRGDVAGVAERLRALPVAP